MKPIIVKSGEFTFLIDNPTPHLRFISRGGRMILQQWWVSMTPPDGDFRNALAWLGAWVDVPVED